MDMVTGGILIIGTIWVTIKLIREHRKNKKVEKKRQEMRIVPAA